ncbi:MAG TPA: AIPR family protein [Streptosporangiaceae bacterium]|nr:AIPR family protein [Streptosporangiaceae bacterium]
MPFLDDKLLRKFCAQYAEKYGYKRDDMKHGLEAYAIHLFAQEIGFDSILDGSPTQDADLREYICRSNDLGIDGVLEDDVNRRMVLIQATWRGRGSSLEEDKVGYFYDVPSRINSPSYVEKGNDQIQELLAGFNEKVANGYDIQLRFVTNARVGDKERLQELVEAKNQTYQDDDLPITCELYGLAELRQRDEELRSALKGGFINVDLHIQEDKFIELKNFPYRTLVGVIKANELVDIYRRRGVNNKLFNLNIRLPLTTKRVNPKMIDTAVDPTESGHFFYYNNGVSAVCSHYEIEGTLVRTKKFQIINGAQTVSALVKARRRNQNMEAYVLFRLTETTEQYGGAFTENIIRYNNTQNPVKVSDFFSNDEIQIWLRDNLPKLSGKGPLPVFYYVHKSGYKPPGSTGKGIKIEQLAGIRHAFIYGPVTSYKEPQQFFESRNERYWQAFGEDGREVSSWGPETLAQAGAAIAIHERVQEFGRTIRKSDNRVLSSETKYLFRLARYVTGLVGVGLETIREDSFVNYETLIATSATFNKCVDPILLHARRVLRDEWRRMKEAGSGVQPEYNLARDDKIWTRLSNALRDEILAERDV